IISINILGTSCRGYNGMVTASATTRRGYRGYRGDGGLVPRGNQFAFYLYHLPFTVYRSLLNVHRFF
ncbi:MAG: hypothetical protein WAV76_15770, partial [Bacteroidota bacterium]